MPANQDTVYTNFGDLVTWNEGGDLPAAFTAWDFREDQLETLKVSCQYDDSAQFLALALQCLTDENTVMALIELVA